MRGAASVGGATRWLVVLCAGFSVAASGCVGTEERSAGATIAVAGVDVFSVVREPSGESAGPSVLFLHGASFTAEIWVETGILDSIVAAGHRAIAVDLPGFGRTDSIDGDRGDFLRDVIAEVDDGRGVVVVSPSMSGSFSLDLLESDGAAAMAGFVPIAPVGIPEFVPEPGSMAGFASLVVWGAADDVVEGNLAGTLADRLGAGTPTFIADAGHAAYKDQPEEFVRLLSAFLTTLR